MHIKVLTVVFNHYCFELRILMRTQPLKLQRYKAEDLFEGISLFWRYGKREKSKD